jgi:hypothetical protein
MLAMFGYCGVLHGGDFTHPGSAALADPLFACGGKRVRKKLNIKP